MQSWHATVLATFVSFGFGGAAQTLYAQAKPPIYLISEIEPIDIDIYMKRLGPRPGEKRAKRDDGNDR
jgi:hypothetical protein